MSGDKGTGKSYFCTLFREHVALQDLHAHDLVDYEQPLEQGRVYIAEDITPRNMAPTTLLHLINRACEAKAWLVLTSLYAAPHYPTTLADLDSRLKVLPTAHLDVPDEDFLMAMIAKLLSQRQLQFTPEVLQFLVKRIERSTVVAREVVARLDHEAMARHRNITIHLARDVLADFT